MSAVRTAVLHRHQFKWPYAGGFELRMADYHPGGTVYLHDASTDAVAIPAPLLESVGRALLEIAASNATKGAAS